jgi:hypothetical protein
LYITCTISVDFCTISVSFCILSRPLYISVDYCTPVPSVWIFVVTSVYISVYYQGCFSVKIGLVSRLDDLGWCFHILWVWCLKAGCWVGCLKAGSVGSLFGEDECTIFSILFLSRAMLSCYFQEWWFLDGGSVPFKSGGPWMVLKMLP